MVSQIIDENKENEENKFLVFFLLVFQNKRKYLNKKQKNDATNDSC